MLPIIIVEIIPRVSRERLDYFTYVGACYRCSLTHIHNYRLAAHINIQGTTYLQIRPPAVGIWWTLMCVMYNAHTKHTHTHTHHHIYYGAYTLYLQLDDGKQLLSHHSRPACSIDYLAQSCICNNCKTVPLWEWSLLNNDWNVPHLSISTSLAS